MRINLGIDFPVWKSLMRDKRFSEWHQSFLFSNLICNNKHQDMANTNRLTFFLSCDINFRIIYQKSVCLLFESEDVTQTDPTVAVNYFLDVSQCGPTFWHWKVTWVLLHAWRGMGSFDCIFDCIANSPLEATKLLQTGPLKFLHFSWRQINGGHLCCCWS